MTSIGDIRNSLRDGLAGVARRVLIGLNWTLVEGEYGIGLAHTPARGTSGCYGLSDAGCQRGRGLADIAAGLESDNPFDRASALAAVNAHHNRGSIDGDSRNGLDLAAERGGKTVVIGRFPGLERIMPDAAVIERSPGPDDHPVEDAPKLLPEADQLVITASAFADGSVADYLDLAPQAFCVVVGPGAPLCPALFERGVDVIAGFVIEDADAAFEAIAEGGAVRALKRCGRNVCLIRN
jgi:uncharacterized protein (DUF4213/DUF364 family)